jgi:tight adherence protein B
MHVLMFPILLGGSVGLFTWALARLVFGTDDERRRVSQRLSEDGRNYNVGGSRRSILLHKTESSALALALARKSFFQSVHKQLKVVWPKLSLSRFVAMASTFAALVAGILALLVSSRVVPAAVGAVAWYLPFFILSSRAQRHNRLLSEQLPESLDFLSRILRAGHSLTTGLQMMGTELPEPLAGEFRRCYDQHSVGSPLEACLKEMAERIESTEFAFFVTAVLIQRQTGGDLSMVLGNISSTIRSRIRLSGFVRSKTAGGRLTGYILIAFPIIMFLLASALSPDYGGKLLHTPMGQKLMATAVVLQILGLIAIRKITNVKV